MKEWSRWLRLMIPFLCLFVGGFCLVFNGHWGGWFVIFAAICITPIVSYKRNG